MANVTLSYSHVGLNYANDSLLSSHHPCDVHSILFIDLDVVHKLTYNVQQPKQFQNTFLRHIYMPDTILGHQC